MCRRVMEARHDLPSGLLWWHYARAVWQPAEQACTVEFEQNFVIPVPLGDADATH